MEIIEKPISKSELILQKLTLYRQQKSVIGVQTRKDIPNTIRLNKIAYFKDPIVFRGTISEKNKHYVKKVKSQ